MYFTQRELIKIKVIQMKTPFSLLGYLSCEDRFHQMTHSRVKKQNLKDKNPT